MGILDASLYRPGTTLLHRARPGAKLIGLSLFATVTVIVDTLAGLSVTLTVAMLVALYAGLRPRDLWRLLRSFAIFGLIIFAFQWWQNTWQNGAELVAELLALIVASTVLTATTPVDEMIDTITWALGPFRRFGVNPAAIGLAFSLAIRAIPTTETIARESRAAAKARGLDNSTRAFAVPLVIRTVAHARETGAALQARGIGDD